ncbi:MAG: type III-B CRISPR module-associated protein Cmr5 [Acetobacteraceae bacterium]
MSAAQRPARPLRKDQQRALDAYAYAKAAQESESLEEYQIAVQSFAATLLRSGLAAAVSTLERSVKERNGFQLLLHALAKADNASDPTGWPAKIRSLPLEQYILTTRELIALLVWMRRACRALDGKQVNA